MGFVCGLGLAARSVADTYVWVDANGVTQLTDDLEAVPEDQRTGEAGEVDRLRALWSDGILGPVTRTPVGSSGGESDRVLRLLRAAIADLRRGEVSRATATLRGVKRIDPKRAETYWYLALLDRQRGRYQGAEENLHKFLEFAGDDLESWRHSAERRLANLEDEKRLADPDSQRGRLQLLAVDGPHFRVELDADLDRVDPYYASTVLDYLEEAREGVSSQIGVMPLEPLGVVLYGKAAYLRAHRHRFSFQTVGFFDGRIHVTSPAHPSGSLRSLLFHEYTHAVFREQTGSDRPYWLNEGLAEQMERRSRQLETSTRSERVSMRARIEAGSWIPLRKLAPSFSGLSDADARAAYLESVITAGWIEKHSTREIRARLLRRLGEGFSIDQALHEALGIDTEELEAAVKRDILGEFPPLDS